MKFKGKKAIMAAALSAIVAAGSFGTAITASADDTYYFIDGSTYCEPGATGTIAYGEWAAHAGDEITVTVTPGSNSYISNFTVKVSDWRGIEAIWHEYNTITYEPIRHKFNMPAANVKIYATFGFDPTHPTTPTEPTTPTTPTAPTESTAPRYKKGDVNLDGYVNAKDATLVLKHAAKLTKLTGQGYMNADVNGDGYINAKDATEILKIAVGLA